MRPFVIRVSLLVGLLASAAIVAAQPADKSKDKAAIDVPEDAIIALYDVLTAMEKSPSHVLLSPARYQAMVDKIKRLESLRRYLNTDLPRGISYLLQAQQILESYSESAPAPKTTPAPLVEEGR